MDTLRDIRSLTVEELESFFSEHNKNSYRVSQVWKWLWKIAVRIIDQMTNLPKRSRELLNQHFTLLPLDIGEMQQSRDGTLKVGFKTHTRITYEYLMLGGFNDSL